MAEQEINMAEQNQVSGDELDKLLAGFTKRVEIANSAPQPGPAEDELRQQQERQAAASQRVEHVRQGLQQTAQEQRLAATTQTTARSAPQVPEQYRLIADDEEGNTDKKPWWKIELPWGKKNRPQAQDSSVRQFDLRDPAARAANEGETPRNNIVLPAEPVRLNPSNPTNRSENTPSNVRSVERRRTFTQEELKDIQDGRNILNEIENSNRDLTHDFRNTDRVERLNEICARPTCPEEFKRERKARLSLYATEDVVVKLTNNPDDPGYLATYIETKITELQQGKLLLDGRDFSLLFREGLIGMDVNQAFQLLQKASRSDGLLVNGRNIRRSNEKITPDEQEEVDKEIIRLLKVQNPELTQENAEKSLELADRIATATFEKAVWDREAATVFGKVVHLKTARVRSMPPNMIRGPDITYNFANGLAGSFLRTAAYKQEELRPDGAVVKVNHLLLRDADSQAGMIRERGNTRGPFRNDTLSRNRQGSIDPASFDWEKLPANAWADYGTYVNRAIQLASLFQKSTWDMEEARKLFDKINTFNKTVDPDNEMSLGAILSLGIVDSIAQNLQSTGARSNMHLGDISKFARDLAGEDGIIFGNSPVPDEARDEASEIINSIVKETHIKRETMINIWLKALSGKRTTYGMDVIFGGGE